MIHTPERRANWKAAISRAAQERAQRIAEMQQELTTLQAEMRACGTDWKRYDELGQQYRETVAKIATF